MIDTPDSSLFPWEDQPPPHAEPAQAPASADPYDPNSVPPIPAEVAPDDAAERVHQNEFAEPEVRTPDVTELSPAASVDEAGVSAAGVHDAAAREGAEPPAARRSEGHSRPLVRKEYYAISEVAELVGLPAHVLRYWESQFSVLNPSKNRSGNRVYQRKEIRLILLVKQLLYEDKYTVEGAKQRLDQLRRGGGLQEATTHALSEQVISGLREELRSLSELLAPDAH